MPLADPPQGPQQVFQVNGLGDELLRPGAHRLQDQLAVVRRADHQHGAVGRGLVEPADQAQGLARIRVQADHADVGVGLGHDVGEEFVARALRLQPDHVHAQEHVLEFLTLRIVGINDGYAKDVAHGSVAEA